MAEVKGGKFPSRGLIYGKSFEEGTPKQDEMWNRRKLLTLDIMHDITAG